jgi:hypothetical protein
MDMKKNELGLACQGREVLSDFLLIDVFQSA